jgi:hypothetical protein
MKGQSTQSLRKSLHLGGSDNTLGIILLTSGILATLDGGIFFAGGRIGTDTLPLALLIGICLFFVGIASFKMNPKEERHR